MSSHQARDYGGARTVPSTLAPAHHPLMPVMDRPGAWLGGQTGSTGRPTSGSATASGTGTSGTVAVVIDEGGGESGTPEEGGDGEGGGVGERAGAKVSGRKGGERWRESRQGARLRAHAHTAHAQPAQPAHNLPPAR